MTTEAQTPEKKTSAPIFYTRQEAPGTKIAFWEAPQTSDKSPAVQGKIGDLSVSAWEAKTKDGQPLDKPFFNVKAELDGKLTQIGTANAFVNDRGFNSFSISLKSASMAEAEQLKAKLGAKEAIKEVAGKGDAPPAFFMNLYADVSVNAIKANPDEFKRLGFTTEMVAKKAPKP